MSKERLSQLLQQADRAAGLGTMPGSDLAERVRRSAQQRRIAVIAEPIALAAVLMIVVGIAFWVDKDPGATQPSKVSPPTLARNTQNQDVPEPTPEKTIIARRETGRQDAGGTEIVSRPDAGGTAETDTEAELAQLRMEIAQLRAEADARMQIVKELLEHQKHQAKLAELERQLAAMPDPLEEVHRQLEKAAYTKLYYAELKYQKPAQRDSALEEYQGVIALYPQTRWADVARKKLSEIRGETKGALL